MVIDSFITFNESRLEYLTQKTKQLEKDNKFYSKCFMASLTTTIACNAIAVLGVLLASLPLMFGSIAIVGIAISLTAVFGCFYNDSHNKWIRNQEKMTTLINQIHEQKMNEINRENNRRG